MSRKLDQILVVDIEATCWEGDPPPNQENEIIEIGICPLDIASGQLLAKESILVKPSRSQVSAFCTQLTTLTQAQVDEGISFAEACSLLRKKYLSRQRVWASYGEYDKNQFHRQCEAFGLKYPFSTIHLNVKSLLAITRQEPQEVWMGRALEILGLPLEGTPHRGVDDAGNIAKVLAKLLWADRR